MNVYFIVSRYVSHLIIYSLLIQLFYVTCRCGVSRFYFSFIIVFVVVCCTHLDKVFVRVIRIELKLFSKFCQIVSCYCPTIIFVSDEFVFIHRSVNA